MAVHTAVTPASDRRVMLEAMNSVLASLAATDIDHDDDPHPAPVRASAPGLHPASCRRLLMGAGTVGIGFGGRPAFATSRVTGVRLEDCDGEPAGVVVSWQSPQPVGWPRVLLGSSSGKFHRAVAAATTRLTGPRPGQVVYAHYAMITDLRRATEYLCAAGHDGADPAFLTFALPSV